MTTAERIQYLRKKHHLTLEEVGRACGVGKSTVRKWEVGEIKSMRIDKVYLLSKALKTNLNYLLGLSNDEGEALAMANEEAGEGF